MLNVWKNTFMLMLSKLLNVNVVLCKNAFGYCLPEDWIHMTDVILNTNNKPLPYHI